MALTIRAAGVLRPAIKSPLGSVVRYVYISLPSTYSDDEVESVRQLLGRLTKPNDVILYTEDSDVDTIVSFAEKYGLFTFPYDPELTTIRPQYCITVLKPETRLKPAETAIIDALSPTASRAVYLAH